MGGNGLKELWTLIYAVDSIKKLLSGHAYDRALRAHSTAVTITIFRKTEFDFLTREQIVSPHESVMNNNSRPPVDAAECHALLSLTAKMETVKHSASSESRTATLWILNLNQVMLETSP